MGNSFYLDKIMLLNQIIWIDVLFHMIMKFIKAWKIVQFEFWIYFYLNFTVAFRIIAALEQFCLQFCKSLYLRQQNTAHVIKTWAPFYICAAGNGNCKWLGGKHCRNKQRLHQ